MNYRPLLLLLSLLAPPALAQQTPPEHFSPAAHQQSVLHFQETLNKEFSNPAESPLTADERKHFKTLPFYPTSYEYYVEATLLRDSLAQPFEMVTSTARRPLYRKYGTLRFVLNGQPQQLAVYQNLELMKRPGFADYLFVPFTDLTNGHGSYGGGRYLDLRIPPAGSTVMQLDFNQAYNPSCAYNHQYSCPVPPAENRLSIAIPAGVQSDH
ncbi:DUF1684 domain-containing protein [Hymenobacter sp. ASUV-10]|uniref:DUF1684 domain-containing protein n=1 Tax=Hymenobacter aranciens TaxID=3063996 RepID=A0ABT9BAL5_9BACT|nr:DUF1684 domain-containing protein [Hymenobacter sp. ASUV-10]MDO7875237.1 DUF1684 domain-containing protein [Hymenobacter sp. ASUV-10]